MELTPCKTSLIRVFSSDVVNGTVVVPDGVITILHSAFETCEEVTTLILPDSVTTIGDAAFIGCTKLTTLILPDSVTTIGKMAFYNCIELTTLTLSAGLKRIDPKTFIGCTKLKTLTLPAAMTTIGNKAFKDCKELTTLTLPAGITTIGDKAFNGCTKLTTLTLSAGLKRIGLGAFNDCRALKTLIIDSPTIEAGEKVRAQLPEYLQKIAVIKDVLLAKAMQAITPLIQGSINGSFPLFKDIVGVIFQHLLPLNYTKENKRNVESVFNVVNNIDNIVFDVKTFTVKYTEVLKNDKFKFFKSTNLNPNWSLIEIIHRGMTHDHTIRQACVELGWLTTNLELSEKAPEYIISKLKCNHASISTQKMT